MAETKTRLKDGWVVFTFVVKYSNGIEKTIVLINQKPAKTPGEQGVFVSFINKADQSQSFSIVDFLSRLANLYDNVTTMKQNTNKI
jgi:hypothetical protein